MTIIDVKKKNSSTRIDDLRSRLDSITELKNMERLTVFVAGSYARNEASVHSDIDLFFVFDGDLGKLQNPNITSMRAFARIIEEADKLSFPAFSNDGEFLKILEKPQMMRELGGRNDDYLNFFTARMLMLLESVPVYNSNTYDHILEEIVNAYFRDYTHHPKDFRPVFLINDIIRFWKTLCLNYENKRNQPEQDRARQIKQKVKNFKLKFSRMLTCYGSIAAIADLPNNSGPKEIIKLGQLSPFERLQNTAGARKSTADKFARIKADYEWFLEVTNVDEAMLLEKFNERAFRDVAFQRAESFGDSMFDVIKQISEETGYLRYLVI
jgi:predicted nucleotidyltransferase